MDLATIFMGAGFGISFILLYTRKKKWNTGRLRWIITASLFLIGIGGALSDAGRTPNRGFYFLFIPFIYNCFDRWFKQLSEKKHGRDFHLYLRHSDEINDRMFAINTHLKTSDKMFSILLLVIIIGLMGLGAALGYRLNH